MFRFKFSQLPYSLSAMTGPRPTIVDADGYESTVLRARDSNTVPRNTVDAGLLSRLGFIPA